MTLKQTFPVSFRLDGAKGIEANRQWQQLKAKGVKHSQIYLKGLKELLKEVNK